SSCTSIPIIRSPGLARMRMRWQTRSARRSRNSCRTARNGSTSRNLGVAMMWVLLVVVAVAVLWVVGAYNGLISLKNQTINAFKQIDVQLKRRHDLIPNLVNSVKGAMDFERSTLEAVIQARHRAVQVNASGPEAIKQIRQAEHALSGALSQ